MSEILESKIDTSSKEFKENYKDLESKTSLIKNLINKTKLGGGEKSIAKHKERGKLTARERIQTLIDKETSFLEIATLAAEGVYPDHIPSGGIITGIGRINGVDCMIVANDATGQQGLAKLMEAGEQDGRWRVVDASGLYAGYKDANAFLA